MRPMTPAKTPAKTPPTPLGEAATADGTRRPHESRRPHRPRWRSLAAVTLTAAVVAGACASDDTGTDTAGPSDGQDTDATPTPSPDDDPNRTDRTGAFPAQAVDRTFDDVPEGVGIEVVAHDLDAPWDVAFAPDGQRAFVTERDTGVISVLEANGERSTVTTIDVDDAGEGGLLGVAVPPDGDGDTIYVYATTDTDNRILTVDVTSGDSTPVFTDIPKSAIHNGGRIAFGPDGMLYAGTGDAADPDLSQDPESLAGKILRIDPDGGIPDDNPLPGSAVWAWGLRNVQGLAWDDDERLWATEFGPDVDDELNLIEAGENYGWPEVTGDSDGEFADPALVMAPAESSPSGMAFVGGDSAWAGTLVFGALRGQRVWQAAPQADGSVDDVAQLFEGTFGRVRTLRAAPDGTLWLVTNNTDGRGQPRTADDLIVRITPPPTS
ncbi:MAG: PQQ-dependent sugar dehydrogenase [Acidimicrobiia bacterium]|nr:PQQ-dependent sugar dehydrogenase [Acidimicrobiia bacterium]